MQPNYLPWLGYFDMLARSDIFVIYDDVQFDKNGWRNRNKILNYPEPLWLTAPVLTADRSHQIIREVSLANSPWQKKHLKTLRHVYSKAPFFEWCYPELDLYLTKYNYKYLLDLCINGHHVFSKLLGIESQLRFSSEIGFANIGRTERLVAICSNLCGTCYIAASASRAYMIEEQWRLANIELRYQDYTHPVYPQSGNYFVGHLSVIDSLMFLGPKARQLIGHVPAC